MRLLIALGLFLLSASLSAATGHCVIGSLSDLKSKRVLYEFNRMYIHGRSPFHWTISLRGDHNVLEFPLPDNEGALLFSAETEVQYRSMRNRLETFLGLGDAELSAGEARDPGSWVYVIRGDLALNLIGATRGYDEVCIDISGLTSISFVNASLTERSLFYKKVTYQSLTTGHLKNGCFNVPVNDIQKLSKLVVTGKLSSPWGQKKRTVVSLTAAANHTGHSNTLYLDLKSNYRLQKYGLPLVDIPPSLRGELVVLLCG